MINTSVFGSSSVYVCMCAAGRTLLHQEIRLYSVEFLTLPTGFLQLILAVGEPPLLLPHGPLVILVNVLQLLVWTLEDLPRTQSVVTWQHKKDPELIQLFHSKT